MKEIKRKNHKKLENEEGATLIIVALLMTAFISMIALVVDLGYAYYNKSLLQASCDAAALAAANYLEKEPTYTRTHVKAIGKGCFDDNMNANMSLETQIQYNLQNDADLDYQIIEEGGKAVKIKVTAKLESPTGFATIFGVDHVDVGAYAIAEARQGPRDSIWRYAIFSNESVGFSTGNLNVVGAIGSNGNINLQDSHVTISDSLGEYPESGKIAAAGTVSGTSNVQEGTNITSGAPNYGFATYCNEFDAWVESTLKFSLSSISYFDSPGSMDSGPTPDWDIITLSDGSKAAKLKASSGYSSDLNIHPSGCSKIVVPNGCNLYVHGDASFGARLVIEEGATVYITGNCNLNNSFTCNGNIIVDGNLQAGGGQFSSQATANKSIIYVKGSGGTSLGQAATNVDGVMIVAPNCSSLSLNGGGSTIKGSIIGNHLSDLGSGSLTVEYPGDRNPWEKDINGVRLVE